MGILIDLAEGAQEQAKDGNEYTAEDLKELARLLRELSKLEDWPDGDLTKALKSLGRMAPIRVSGVLRELRKAHAAARAALPGKPPPRQRIVLCHLWVVKPQGSSARPQEQRKSLDMEGQAA